MKRISIKVTVCFLTFLIGVIAAAIWTIREPSQRDSRRQGSTALELPLGFCDLIEGADRFESRQIRVEANLIGYHEPALYSPGCKREDSYVRADFDTASREKLIQGVDRLSGAGLHGGNFWIQVILSGHFEKITDPDRSAAQQLSGERKYVEYRYRLVVSSVEKVEAVSDDMPWW